MRVTAVKASELPGDGFGMLMPALEGLRIRSQHTPQVEPHVSILRTFPKVHIEPRILPKVQLEPLIRVVPRAPLMARTRTITI